MGRLLWCCAWKSGSFKFPRGRKGPLPVPSPLPHPTETMRVVAGSPEEVQGDRTVKLLPARKWMVCGSREEGGGGEEEAGREKGRRDAFAADLCHTEAGCPSHQQLLDPETSLRNPAQEAMRGMGGLAALFLASPGSSWGQRVPGKCIAFP